jgi:hypothetical protein
MRRASMRWRVGASVARIRPVQEDEGRGPTHTAITCRQVCEDRVLDCCANLRLSIYVQQRSSRSRLLTFGKAKNLDGVLRHAPDSAFPLHASAFQRRSRRAR